MLPLQEGIVYGPVLSRRLGWSLGLNIMPRSVKLCSFNCSYCQYGWTKTQSSMSRPGTEVWPAPGSIAKALSLVLGRLAGPRTRLSHITLAGNGEPTLHPRFPEVVSALRQVRDHDAPGVALAILSNSSTLDRAPVVAALNELDVRYMKLDAADPALLRRINAATMPIEQILDGLTRLRDVVVQAMFVRDRLGRIDNTSDLAVATWVSALARIKPKAVQVYTIDREPAWPYLQAVSSTRLEEIARRVRAAGIEAQAFLPGQPAAASMAAGAL